MDTRFPKHKPSRKMLSFLKWLSERGTFHHFISYNNESTEFYPFILTACVSWLSPCPSRRLVVRVWWRKIFKKLSSSAFLFRSCNSGQQCDWYRWCSGRCAINLNQILTYHLVFVSSHSSHLSQKLSMPMVLQFFKILERMTCVANSKCDVKRNLKFCLNCN